MKIQYFEIVIADENEMMVYPKRYESEEKAIEEGERMKKQCGGTVSVRKVAIEEIIRL